MNDNGAAAKSEKSVTKADFIEIYTQSVTCIDREDHLINFRLSWALQVNVALVALIFVRDKLSFMDGNIFLIIISGFGMLFTITSLSAIRAAHNQLHHLRHTVERAAAHVDPAAFSGRFDNKRDLALGNVVRLNTGLPRPYGVQQGFAKLGDYAPLIYCISIALMWAVLLVRNIP